MKLSTLVVATTLLACLAAPFRAEADQRPSPRGPAAGQGGARVAPRGAPARPYGPAQAGPRRSPPPPAAVGSSHYAVPRPVPPYGGSHYGRPYYAPQRYYAPGRYYYGGRPYYYGGGSYYYGGPHYYARPYYSFRPHFSIGFGLWAGYPVPYAYFGFGYQYPGPYTYSYPYPYGSTYPAPYSTYGYPAPAASVSVSPGVVSQGGISFEITPSDAEVYVDGAYAGEVGQFTPNSPPLALATGTHRVEIRRAGYQTLVFDAIITAGQVVPYRGALEPVRPY